LGQAVIVVSEITQVFIISTLVDAELQSAVLLFEEAQIGELRLLKV
jgi:hypothetical protein